MRVRPLEKRARLQPRRGSLLAEVAMATVMLGIGMTLALKVTAYVGLQRRSAEQRQRAVQEVANAMERLTAYPYEQVTAERGRSLAISPTAAQTLPDAELSVAVHESQPSADRPAKRIAIRLRWRNRGGEWESPVRLTTWIERRRVRP